MRYNLAAPDTFAKVVKVMNHIWLWDAKLVWYSLSSTPWIYLYGLVAIFLGLPDLASSCKPSKISSTFCLLYSDQLHLHLSHNVFGWFCSIMAQFELVPKLNYILCSSVWLLNYIPSEAMHNMSVHQLPSYYLPQLELLQLHVICAAN